MKSLKVEYEATDSLVPYAKNANIHTEEQIEQIVESIKAFGFNDPIGVWTNENGESEVVEGHGRILAAKRLELEKVPVIHLDTLTDEQRRAYTHVHNQQTRNSEWDFNMLDCELSTLNFDFEALGFDFESISVDDLDDEFSLPDGEQGEIRSMTFVLHVNQLERIQDALENVGECRETYGNENKNGNALFELVKQWEDAKK